MVVKVQLADSRDRRHRKRLTVLDKDRNILFTGEADRALVEKMDGATYAYFEARLEHSPSVIDGIYNKVTKTKIHLDIRLNNKRW